MTGSTNVPQLFDHVALRARLRRAERLGPVTFLLDSVRDDLVERLSVVLRSFSQAIDLGTPLAGLQTVLRQRSSNVAWIDLFAPAGERLRLAPQSIDLAASALALQFANDL